MTETNFAQLPLGKPVKYISTYTPSLLFPIARKAQRDANAIPYPPPFDGVDLWNAYELSWLEHTSRKPRIAMAEFFIPCHSEYLIESKSLKLYLNSFNQTEFKNETEVKATLQQDLSNLVGTPVRVNLSLPPFKLTYPIQEFSGIVLDDLPVTITDFTPTASLLSTEPIEVSETLCSHLLKSNCPVTGQPDWASVLIHYEGLKIKHCGLLKYIISFREHQDFHEQCVERIFVDILQRCEPQKLTVYARFNRRGGIDINPFRSNFQSLSINTRNFRQ